MTVIKWLILLFLSLIHSIIGITMAKRRGLPALLGGLVGFSFLPVFFQLLPSISSLHHHKSK